jgi:hypothetical protein
LSSATIGASAPRGRPAEHLSEQCGQAGRVGVAAHERIEHQSVDRRHDRRYDRHASLYDRLVRSRLYNRLAWSTSPAHYTRFAAAAFAESDGPLLELAGGTAAATAALHARSNRPAVLVDLSRAMLERAAERIATHAGTSDELPPHVRLVQADLFALPFAPGRQTDHRSPPDRTRLGPRATPLGRRTHLRLAAFLPPPQTSLGTPPRTSPSVHAPRLRDHLPAVPARRVR